MKKLFILMMLILSVFTGCFSGKEENTKTPEVAVKPKIDVTGIVYGKVSDGEGNGVSGVEVSAGGESFISDENGFYILEDIKSSNGKMIVKFEKDGYFDITRAESVSESVKKYEVNAKMISKKGTNAKVGVISAASGGSLEISNGSKVELPANGVVDKDGKEYSGIINVSAAYLDPTKAEFGEIMPGGEMDAVRTDGSETLLVSYGVLAVELKDEYGDNVQIKSGSKSKITVAVAESQRATAPAEIPLWYFDDVKGVWIEDGKAVLSSDKTKYEGEVTHFTYWNCDVPSPDQAKISGYVKDKDGNGIPEVLVKLGQVYAYTNGNGYYTRRVPSGVKIDTALISIGGNSIQEINGDSVTLTAGESKTINFTIDYNLFGVVYGYVNDSQGVVENAKVVVGNNLALTDEKGFYKMSIIPNREYNVYTGNFDNNSRIVKLKAGEYKEESFSLANEPKYVKFILKNSNGENIEGTVHAFIGEQKSIIWINSGGYELNNLMEISSNEKILNYKVIDINRNFIEGSCSIEGLRNGQAKNVIINMPKNSNEEYFEVTVDGKLRSDIGTSKLGEIYMNSAEDNENSSISISGSSGTQYGSSILMNIYNKGKTGEFILDSTNTNSYIDLRINDNGENGYPEYYHIGETDSVKINITTIGKQGTFIEGTFEGTMSNENKKINISGKFKIRRLMEYMNWA